MFEVMYWKYNQMSYDYGCDTVTYTTLALSSQPTIKQGEIY